MGRPLVTKVCPQPGCPNDQPCAEHTPKPWAGSNRRSRLPAGWSARIVPAILQRDHHTCQRCHGTRCGNLDPEVDHIIPNDDHRPENLQTLGHTCHVEKTNAEAAAARTR